MKSHLTLTIFLLPCLKFIIIKQEHPLLQNFSTIGPPRKLSPILVPKSGMNYLSISGMCDLFLALKKVASTMFLTKSSHFDPPFLNWFTLLLSFIYIKKYFFLIGLIQPIEHLNNEWPYFIIVWCNVLCMIVTYHYYYIIITLCSFILIHHHQIFFHKF